jgi:hypothetical protein
MTRGVASVYLQTAAVVSLRLLRKFGVDPNEFIRVHSFLRRFFQSFSVAIPFALSSVSSVSTAITASARRVLFDRYSGTHDVECVWYGIVCDGGQPASRPSDWRTATWPASFRHCQPIGVGDDTSARQRPHGSHSLAGGLVRAENLPGRQQLQWGSKRLAFPGGNRPIK